MTKLRFSLALLGLAGGLCVPGAIANAQNANQVDNGNQIFFSGTPARNRRVGDNTPGARQSARLISNVEFNDNYDLRPDSLGNALIWTTTLGYGVERRTLTDEFEFDAQGSVRVSDLPEIGTDVLADDPRIRLFLGRQIDDNDIYFGLRYQRADLDYFDPLGDLDIDGSFDDTISGGTRESIRSTFGLALNQQGPVSLELAGAYSQINFYDTDDPDLNDRERATTRADLGFALSPILRMTAGAFYDREWEEGADDFDRETKRADIGFDGWLNPRARAVARIGYSDVNVSRTSGDSSDTGLVGDLRFFIDDKTGQTRFALASRRDENGLRTDVTAGRTETWDTGELVANIGASTNDATDWRPIGLVRYTYDMPRSRLTASFRQATNVDSEGRDVVNTGVNIGYTQAINRVSSFGLGAGGGLQRFENSERKATERVNLTAQYNHALTRDWTMNAGYRYTMRDSEDEDRSRSNAVFIGVRRDWEGLR